VSSANYFTLGPAAGLVLPLQNRNLLWESRNVFCFLKLAPHVRRSSLHIRVASLRIEYHGYRLQALRWSYLAHVFVVQIKGFGIALGLPMMGGGRRQAGVNPNCCAWPAYGFLITGIGFRNCGGAILLICFNVVKNQGARAGAPLVGDMGSASWCEYKMR
jgi:hypothetical protein